LQAFGEWPIGKENVGFGYLGSARQLKTISICSKLYPPAAEEHPLSKEI